MAVLWPRAAWAFNLSATLIIGQLNATTPDEDTAHRELALRHEANYDANEARLVRRFDGLFWLFRAACVALAIEVLAWLVVLAL